LRRTLWLYDSDEARISFTLNAHDPLAQRLRAGDTLAVLAPLGRAISFGPGTHHILLICEGTHPIRLVAIAHEQVRLGREVVVLLVTAAAGGEEIAPLLAPEIELRTNTSVDSELIAWADGIVANGADDFYRELRQVILAERYRVQPGFARAVLEMSMPCGTGICYACAVDTSRGIKRLCLDGPVLDLADLK
jgi:dihydroorotate dehydrogenase electron transfer subunit